MVRCDGKLIEIIIIIVIITNMFDSMISYKFENISMFLPRRSSNAILRSKWEAWTSFNGISQDKAMTDFIDLIQSIQSKFSEEHSTTMVSRPLPAVPNGSNITDSRRESLTQFRSPIQPTAPSSASSSTINHNQSISSQQQQQQQQVISSTALTNSINNFQYLLIALLLPVFLFYLIGGSGRGVSFIIGIIIIIKYLLYKYHLGTPMRKSKNSNIPAPLVPIPRGRTLVRMPIDLGPILRFLDAKKKKEAVVVVDTLSSSSSTASTSSSSANNSTSSNTNANNGNNNGVAAAAGGGGGGGVKKHDITISHLALKACAATIAEIPSLNGYVMGSGDFYPAKKQGVDLSLSLDISDKDTVLLKIDDADMKSIDTITNEISYRSKVLRDECKVGMKQQKQTLRTRLLDYLSPSIAEVIDTFLTRLGTMYGLHIPALDILPFPSGVCAVIASPSVEGDMDVDVMFVPSYSTSDFNSSDLASSYNIPIIVSIGSMRVLPALEAQQKQISGTLVLNCSISIDNCAANMTEVRRFCAKLQKFLKDPSLLEGRDKKNITASK